MTANPGKRLKTANRKRAMYLTGTTLDDIAGKTGFTKSYVSYVLHSGRSNPEIEAEFDRLEEKAAEMESGTAVPA